MCQTTVQFENRDDTNTLMKVNDILMTKMLTRIFVGRKPLKNTWGLNKHEICFIMMQYFFIWIQALLLTLAALICGRGMKAADRWWQRWKGSIGDQKEQGRLHSYPSRAQVDSDLQQGRIHGHPLRTGGQGRICAFSHFSIQSPLRTDQPTNQPTNQPIDGPTDKRTKPLMELRVRN